MEPVSTALVVAAVTAAATSTGSEAGRGLWASLSALSRRVMGRGGTEDEPPVQPDDDAARLSVLAGLLVERARQDPGFADDLARWLGDVRWLLPDALPAPEVTHVHNEVSGNAQVTGILIQGGRFHGQINAGTPPPAAP